jgi:hypothetical protein
MPFLGTGGRETHQSHPAAEAEPARSLLPLSAAQLLLLEAAAARPAAAAAAFSALRPRRLPSFKRGEKRIPFGK